jgi:MoaA/NifB/PqqE/SkfB family radical SAM enzyme
LRNDARRCLRRSPGPSPAMPAQFLVGVTYKCDSRCTHCNIWADYLKRPQLETSEMTLAEFERFLDGNPQLIQVVTTGGEQFNRSDIVDFWLAMDRRGQRTSCATNAIETDHIIERESFLLERLSGRHLRNFAVSMDGLEEVHDRVRGTPGNFARAWRLFQWARGQEARHPFYRAEISCTLTAANFRAFPAFVGWLLQQGVPPHKIGFMAALPSGHYYKNERNYKPAGDRAELAGIIEDLQRQHPGFARNYFTESYLQWLRDPSSGITCLAGTVFGYIDPYWDVYPCLVLNRKLGNLREHNFDVRKLWQSAALRDFRAEMAARPCTQCFNECNRWNSMRATTGGLFRIAWRQAAKILRGGGARQRWRM